MITVALMEKLPTGECSCLGLEGQALPTGECSCSGLEGQAMSTPVSTTVEDIPDDCMESIMERLALVDHYKGWKSLIKPYSLTASPFSRHWFLLKAEVFCESCPTPGFPNEFDSPDLLGRHDYTFSCLFFDPVQGKEQEILVSLGGLIETPRCYYPSIRLHPRVVTDKGLLLVNLRQYVISVNQKRHYRFLVLNPINNSTSFLPPIPSPLCRCKRQGCYCEAIPLKLTVNMEQHGLKSPLSSSYKAYILERKELPKRCRRSKFGPSIYNFRVTVYDSMTKLWIRTGVEWISTSWHTRIFSMGDGIFYVSTGGETPYYDSRRHILYKFRDGILVGKVKAPAKVKAQRNCISCLHPSNFSYCENDGCGCISATVFESEGKIFFFQQRSWVGPFGKNCISAIVWELNDTEMVWVKLHDIHPHSLQICPRLQRGMNFMLIYEGILLVFRGQQFLSSEEILRLFYGEQVLSSDFCFVAGFDTLKKTWCKVPETLLEILSRPSQQGHELLLDPTPETSYDRGESVIFEPKITIRA